MKVTTEKQLSAHDVLKMRSDSQRAVLDAMHFVRARHNISGASVHLLFLSQIVNVFQLVNPLATQELLRCMVEIHAVRENKDALDTVILEFDAVQRWMLQSFDLFYAQPENGGHA